MNIVHLENQHQQIKSSLNTFLFGGQGNTQFHIANTELQNGLVNLIYEH